MTTDIWAPPASAWAPPPSKGSLLRAVGRWAGLGVLFLAIVAVAGGGVLAHGAVSYAQEQEGAILPGAVIAGVDVGGMTVDEAFAAVSEQVDPLLDRSVTVRWRDHVWETTPRDLGVTHDGADVVATAAGASRSVSWRDLLSLRWQGATRPFSADVTLHFPRGPAEAFVAQIAAEIDQPVRDAEVDYSTGVVQVTHHQVGYRTDREAAVERLMAALTGDADEVLLDVEREVPAFTSGAYDQVLLLRQDEHRLYLYQDGVVTHSWLVAVGTGGYPTPAGEFQVELKRYMPTWINPDPDGWGAGMPLSIGPGPHNPLGVRALNWSGGGAIRFHGTSNIASLGRNASHGCVRLANSDVIELYDLVEVGTPIISLRAGERSPTVVANAPIS